MDAIQIQLPSLRAAVEQNTREMKTNPFPKLEESY
jgi:hypothetical protein